MHTEVLTEQGRRLLPRLVEFNQFYLAGGTALALQIGHRLSDDFDFFSAEPISPNLLNFVEGTFFKESARVAVNDERELTLFINTTKLTFLHYPFPLLEPLIHDGDMKMMSVREIGATKAFTLRSRGALKDYVDLYAILSGRHITLGELLTLARKKYGERFNNRLFLEQLVYLYDVPDAPIKFLHEPIAKPVMAQYFETLVGEIT